MDLKISETKLNTPQDFPFPFSPYPIQEEFMKNLYETIENSKLGVFESPTGTGKSMSIICGSLKWLFDAEERKFSDIRREMEIIDMIKVESNADDWFESHHEQAKAKARKCELGRMLSKMKLMEDRIKETINNKKVKKDSSDIKAKIQWKIKKSKKPVKDIKPVASEGKENLSDEDDVLLDDVQVKSETSDSEDEREAKEDPYFCTKIFLCSRTHSQLTQLAGEIQKSPFQELGVRVVPLASRQNLCINDSVLALKNQSLINEACQELRSRKPSRTTKVSKSGEKIKKIKVSCGCPYTAESNLELLRGECFTQVHDLEELTSAGHALSACPYYTARSCVQDSHIVLVPYQTLLHSKTREASGINLRGSVVIVDEAHNLLDTLGNIHSASVTCLQLCHTHSFLVQYRDRFRDRFTPLNLLNLNQLIFVVNKLVRYFTPRDKPQESSSVYRLANFLIETDIDNINLFTLLAFAARTRLANKLSSYVSKFQPHVVLAEKKTVEGGVASFLKTIANKGVTIPEPAPSVPEPPTSSGYAVHSVLSFLDALTNHCEDGRVVVTIGKTPTESYVKFLLLNPAAHFQDVVEQARSVVLAGGTMQPFSEFTDQLFLLTGASPLRIHTFSCDHVVPPCNILPMTISQGPGGRTLDFNYANRNSFELLDELGRLLVNVCNVVPAGVVVFFVSYDYEDKVYKYFVEKGIIAKLETKKKVLREPKQSNKVETILSQYANAAPSGALLFSVVGGKLSEGLNFNDDLGRCVAVVGMPYPNKTNPELLEKMAYLEEKIGKGAGSVYYENLCMKAVNQSIGRSVRHINDYAVVLLLDQRYSRSHIKAALPQWIRSSLQCQSTFRPVQGLLAQFFTSKKR